MNTETKRTNKDVLVQGIKKMGASLVCMFLGPILIYIAFSNQEKPLYYPLLILGIVACISAIYLAFRGLNTILDSMFKK